MNSSIVQTSTNLLLCMILSHFITDFVLQTNKMVDDKKQKSWKSIYLFTHIAITFLFAILFTKNFYFSFIVSVLHYFIDVLKIELDKRKIWNEIKLLLFDQFLHLISIVVTWYCISFYDINFGLALLHKLSSNNHFILYTLSYILVIYPYSYIVRMSTMPFSTDEIRANSVSSAGKYIGIFERILILTFIYFGAIGSIGLLIAAKSIMRFSEKNDRKQTEYVLIGSLISYVLAILTAIIVQKITVYL